MVGLREETGVQRSLTERLVRSRLQWAGHVERMADERLSKRAAELREQGSRRRGRPRLRWEGEEEGWKKKKTKQDKTKTLIDKNTITFVSVTTYCQTKNTYKNKNNKTTK